MRILQSTIIRGVIEEHLAVSGELFSDLRKSFEGPFWRAEIVQELLRCEAHLDALHIAGEQAIRLGQSAMEDDPEVAGVLAILLAGERGRGENLAEDAVALLCHETAEIRQAAWWGLRLANPEHIAPHLRTLIGRRQWDIASAAALDILAFHRFHVQANVGDLPEEEGDEIAWLLAEAGGRLRGLWKAGHLRQFLRHPSARVREAALRASARCGLPGLAGICRDAAEGSASLEAIEFLGVIGSPEDFSRLLHAVSNPETAKAAILGLGRLGVPDSVPVLLEVLGVADLEDAAATAFERITGQGVARGAPSEPPPGLSEDELDWWEPTSPVELSTTREWWRANMRKFDSSKRYQAGRSVSDDPLGPVFDELPLAVRYDVYLRQRALVPRAPDWELETWPRKQKQPASN